MNDEQFQAWLAQHGGEVGRKDNEKTADDPTNTAPLGPGEKRPQVTTIDTTTITAKDGATLTLRRNPGPYVGNTTMYTVVENTPPKTTATAQKPTNVYIGTNPTTGKQTQVSEYPDGHKEYDDTQVPAAAAGEAKPPTTEDRGGHHYVWQPNPGGPNSGGQWVDAGTAPLTPAERQAQEAAAPTQSVARVKGGDGNEYTVITIVPKPGQPGSAGQVVLGPNGQVAPGGVPGQRPEEKREVVKGPDGKTYVRVTTQKPDGTVELYHTDQSGARVTLPDTAPDQPTAPAPQMPTIVLGASQAALQEYKKKLQEGVSAKLWTQKWADDRWGEAVKMADVAVQEAKTAQNEAESTRNAAINLAQGRATLGQNAIKDSLDYTSKLNGLLPEGSPLGGQTFAALMSLQMLMQARSGIDSIDPRARPGGAPAPIPTISTADVANPQAIQAKRAEIAAHPVFSPPPSVTATDPLVRPPVTAAAAPASPSVLAPAIAGPTPSPAAAPTVPTPSAYPAADEFGRTPAPTPGEPGGPPLQTTIPPYQPPVATSTPDYGASGMTVLPSPAPETPAPSVAAPAEVLPAAPPEEMVTIRNRVTGATQTIPRSKWNSTYTLGIWAEDPAPSPAPADVGTNAPYNADPSQGPVGQAAPSRQEWPVLAAYQPPTAPMSPMPEQPASAAYPAVLASKARSVPPWQLSPQEIEQMQAAGVSDQDIWSIPGRRTAA